MGEPGLISETTSARCTRDLCLATVGGRRVLMTRSAYLVPVIELVAACRAADIVVSERRLPRGCRPRWLHLDRPVLVQTGGLAITLADGRIRTVRTPGDEHPWRRPHTVMPPRDRAAGSSTRRGARPDQSYRRRMPDSLP
jgi:competence protein ComEC